MPKATDINPEAREVLNVSLGSIASNVIYRALDGLADQEAVEVLKAGPDGIVALPPKPKDYDKAISTALKVLDFFDFSGIDTEIDDDTKKKIADLRDKLPNRRKKNTDDGDTS